MNGGQIIIVIIRFKKESVVRNKVVQKYTKSFSRFAAIGGSTDDQTQVCVGLLSVDEC